MWRNNAIPGNSSPVEIWQLAYGGGMICLGLWFYGYNIMRVLGNNLTYQSPSRGFCMGEWLGRWGLRVPRHAAAG